MLPSQSTLEKPAAASAEAMVCVVNGLVPTIALVV